MGTLGRERAKRTVRIAIIDKSYHLAEAIKMKRLISGLGLSDHAYLAGFNSNPYRPMRRAAVIVSSSLTEGC